MRRFRWPRWPPNSRHAGADFVPIGIVAGILALFLIRRFAANRASLPALLKAGLKRDEILTVYQPIVDMRTGNWVGVEVSGALEAAGANGYRRKCSCRSPSGMG